MNSKCIHNDQVGGNDKTGLYGAQTKSHNHTVHSKSATIQNIPSSTNMHLFPPCNAMQNGLHFFKHSRQKGKKEYRDVEAWREAPDKRSAGFDKRLVDSPSHHAF